MAGTDKGFAPVLPAYPPLPAANRRHVALTTETEGMNDRKGPMRRRPCSCPLNGWEQGRQEGLSNFLRRLVSIHIEGTSLR